MIAAVSAAAVAALAPVAVTATSGPVTATLTGIGASSGDTITTATGLRLTIARGGAVAFNAPLRPCRFGCDPGDSTGARQATLRLRDLDADGGAGGPRILALRAAAFAEVTRAHPARVRRHTHRAVGDRRVAREVARGRVSGGFQRRLMRFLTATGCH